MDSPNSGSSSSSELIPSNDDRISCVTTTPIHAAPTYMLFFRPIGIYLIIRRSCECEQPPQGPQEGSEQPLSTKRGTTKRGRRQHEDSVSATSVQRGRKTAAIANVVSVVAASAPASIQDMTSLIEEFTEDVADSPAAKRKRVNNTKPRPFLEETSTVTTPGNTPRTGARARSETSVVPRNTSSAKQSAASKKKKNAKPELVTPAEFARRLRDQGPGKAVQPPQHLKDYVIFYTGGDLTYASARTRGCMSYVRSRASLPYISR